MSDAKEEGYRGRTFQEIVLIMPNEQSKNGKQTFKKWSRNWGMGVGATVPLVSMPIYLHIQYFEFRISRLS